MASTYPRLCALVLLMLAGGAGGQTAPRDEEKRIEFFEKKVRPILADNCYNCHSASTNARGGLRLDDRNGLLLGGGRGPALVLGQPEKSLLIEAVRQTHAEVKMPPKKQLNAEQIADLSRWIQDGAAWPRVVVPASIEKPSAKYEKLRKEHWAWQPLREPGVPAVKDTAWPRSSIDRFILAGLEAQQLQPVADADPQLLMRRLTFDLTGLPPTPQEVDAFVKQCQSSPLAAYEQLVDRLLASPAYGERWGRHWLDVARYAESTGSSRNVPYPHAWRYRDYVIDAFNNDKPFDQFVREQIAGDLLPAASAEQRNEQLIATGFLALGVRDVNQRFKVRFVMDNIDEQIDTVSRGIVGLSVSCARCHNHKFDPIPTAEYYALAGIFQSSDLCAGVRNKMGGGGMDYYDTALLLRLGPAKSLSPRIAEQIEQTKVALAKTRAEIAALQESEAGPDRDKELAAARLQLRKMETELIALSDPAAQGPVALGVRDARVVGDTEIRIRGEAEKLGPVVPRGFLSLFEVPDAPRVNPKQSGRLELAQWLSSRHNPLTARVIANRVWHHLFGQGIVRSVDNFGVTGDVPAHPELLDFLAFRYIENGWSTKTLIRQLVLSRAYQLSSAIPQSAIRNPQLADPGNRLFWRHSPRRLDAEEIRDAMLAAAGRLDRQRPTGSPAENFKVMELRNNGPEAERLATECLASKQRSIYLPLLRGLTPGALAVFDFAEQGMVTGDRDTTTVAPQALYLLNDPFVRQQSQAMAGRLLGARGLDEAGRIQLAYRLTLGRRATAHELGRARNYLAEYESAVRQEETPPTDVRTATWASFCQAILASAEFRYVR